MKFPYVLGIPTMVNEYLLAVSCTLIYLTITYGTRLLSFRVCVMGESAPDTGQVEGDDWHNIHVTSPPHVGIGTYGGRFLTRVLTRVLAVFAIMSSRA